MPRTETTVAEPVELPLRGLREETGLSREQFVRGLPIYMTAHNLYAIESGRQGTQVKYALAITARLSQLLGRTVTVDEAFATLGQLGRLLRDRSFERNVNGNHRGRAA